MSGGPSGSLADAGENVGFLRGLVELPGELMIAMVNAVARPGGPRVAA